MIDHSDPRSIDWAGVQHAIGAACDAKRVLVEGTFALEHPIRELARWAVYLHTPDDVRLARKILRKFEDGGDPRASLLGYLARGRAAHHQHVASKRSFADFELDGAQTIEHLVDQLSTAIRL
ncbi:MULTISPECIES: hypothetical protein [unclassified Streptomyces]|uniref:hypothetical protein n=1 Tax=unclassified Streptomyces TaxID=2593676 RepID=UPI0037A9D3EA